MSKLSCSVKSAQLYYDSHREEPQTWVILVYATLCTEAAKGRLVQNDDTKARILSVIEERKKKKEAGQKEKRVGTFTTGILSELEDPTRYIGLFFTGRQHAGENLNDILDQRPEELAAPLQQCDGGNNIPKNHDTKLACCLAHARRKFYDLVDYYKAEVLQIIGWFSEIFFNEQKAPKDPEKKLKWHQEKSKPIMEKLKSYLQ